MNEDLQRVAIGIIHDPHGVAPEFHYQMLRLARFITRDLKMSPVYLPYARGIPKESLDEILLGIKCADPIFHYAIIVKDHIYPPIYSFKYFILLNFFKQ